MKLVMAGVLAVAAGSAAAGISIYDGNSAAGFDPGAGQVSWSVDGTSEIFRQEFWFRRNGVDGRELRVDSTNMTLNGTYTTDTNPFTDNRHDAYGVLYSLGGLQVEVLYTLRGGLNGSGTSDLAEQITLRNTGNASMSLSFFQFVDFDLGGDALDDFAQILNPNAVRQSDSAFTVAETVITPAASMFGVGDAGALYSLLADGDIDNLPGTTSYAGDAAWGFQWNITLGAGQSFLISKDKSITPAPAALVALGLGGLVGGRRRR